MDNESPLKALIVVTATALVCSVLVTVTAVTLQPIQRAYRDLERNRYIVGTSGLLESVDDVSDRKVIAAFRDLDARIIDLERGGFDSTFDPDTFDTRKAAVDPELSVTIPADQDVAGLGRRSRFATVYLVRNGDELDRIIFPIYGPGMWSTLRGFLALENDLTTIADITFHEQGETAGIGDRILRADWQAGWRGRKLYDEKNTLRFKIAKGAVDPGSRDAVHEIDALTGATVTTDGVTNLVRYWFGPHGFAPFLRNFPMTGGS